MKGHGLEVFEMHSRMSQPARTKATDGFRKAGAGVMFASDVIARGIDFPNVTAVVQLGAASAVDQCK
jgi:ATP-dependent RNA helicase MSS116